MVSPLFDFWGMCARMAVRVLHVVRPVKGGMRKHLEMLFRGLDPERYFLYLASSESELFSELRPFIKGEFFLPISETWDPFRNWHVIYSLSRLIGAYDIDLVHTHGILAGIIGATAALLAGCRRVVATAHNFPKPGTPFFWAYRVFLALLARMQQSHLITVSNALKKEIERLGWFPEDRISVVCNGLDVGYFPVGVARTALREQLGINGNWPVIGTVARLEPQKGVRILLEALKYIDKEYGPVYLLIVGDGPERGSLQRFAVELNLAERVIFTGYRSDVRELLSLLDVVAVPSLSEGFSIFCLEALAAGRPVVASSVGGLRDLIQHERTGFLVPPGDAKAMGAVIVSLLSERVAASNLGRRGRDFVARRFTGEQMIAGTAEVYEIVLKGRQ
ncbi:glycosyltransferase [Thermacetogenium phaeum DSM 12270]|uniref:Glycosyltransferase n=2 Tax=Thermacetogenium phaeum TaxID=85874 RepID=K4LI78_THEPS|nr:glycosyltransferase [Thermacetogenium phaeum DSM 12270]